MDWTSLILFIILALMPNALSNQNITSHLTSTTDVPKQECCKGLFLTKNSPDISEFLKCKSKCIEGIALFGLNCGKDKLVGGDLNNIGTPLNEITEVKGRFILLQTTSRCPFEFTSLKTIKAAYVEIKNVDTSDSFLEGLISIESPNPSCDLEYSFANVTGSPEAEQRFKNAIAKGREDCNARNAPSTTAAAIRTSTTSSPAMNVSATAGAGSILAAQNSQKGTCKDGSDTSCMAWRAGLIASCVVAFLIAALSIIMLVIVVRRRPKRRPPPNKPYPLMNKLIDSIFYTFEEEEAQQIWTNKKVREDKDKMKAFCYEKENFTPKKTKKYPPEQAPKIRYGDVFCWDASRVKLIHPKPVVVEGAVEPLQPTDFIHANIVDMPGRKKHFIAAQGPKEETCEDFWQMIFQENVQKIFMVSEPQENNIAKVAQYFPLTLNEARSFGCYKIRCFGSSLFHFECATDVQVRVTRLEASNEKKTLLIEHYEWLDWADHQKPPLDMAMFEILDAVRDTNGPIIVHCSAGVGRTGCVLYIEYILAQIREGQEVDGCYEILAKIRQQRCNVIQNWDQFQFVNQLILVYLQKMYEVFGPNEKETEDEEIDGKMNKENGKKTEKKDKKSKDSISRSEASNLEKNGASSASTVEKSTTNQSST